ncbi:dephospho-CoA kinase [Thalassotalea marina]|uniref:Dephospho-CoA kinase n=1 Tax=Thalassotalea marina TaxID=1673741 RepID=A0A919EHM6_9GAMM|nr:dephospho-CoA kinase [Thalassotalea marina]GHF79579.1 dephospho-CoA kinase [Thalassotalea marina]
MSKLIIGLTGGIGSGKTTVSNLLADYGITIVDADVVAREVVAEGSLGLKEIVAKFGATILQEDGQLNRAKLRELIFSDEQLKQWLNALLHPLIRESILNQLKSATSPYCILSAPLLFENNLHQYTNRTLLIDVEKEIQITRTSKRDNVEKKQVEAIIASQMPREDKLALADDVLNNSKLTHLELENAVEKLHLNYLDLAAKLN